MDYTKISKDKDAKLSKTTKIVLAAAGILVAVAFMLRPLYVIDAQIVYDGKYGDSSTVAEDEMKSFLKVWSQYVKMDDSAFALSGIYTKDTDMSKHIPFVMRRWINNQGWDVNRFFFVEQRLKNVVKYTRLVTEAKENVAMLKELKQKSEDEFFQKNVNELIEAQANYANVENISLSEMRMVTPNLDVIDEILQGTAEYK